MAELLTAEVIAALLGLATVIMTGLFQYARAKGKVSDEQGDILLAAGKAQFGVIKVVLGNDPKYAAALKEGEAALDALDKAWNDSKVMTPQMQEYFDNFEKVLEALMKVYGTK